uniref:SMP-LTD domain-containing protein n=1 Tax=Lutzomyia longipalpis TaxID=7200 RepID=A0A1B0CGX2_LUTLO
MDPQKTPKNSKPSGSSIPLTIRFNANEESISEFLKPDESHSGSSPHSDENSWRRDFLQGSFFHRKRSGSPDGQNTGLLSSSEGNTWKLIKGKVTQAMEDIKAPRQENPPKFPNDATGDDLESDLDSMTINSSVSEEFCEAQTSSDFGRIYANKTNESDSENDVDSEILSLDQELLASGKHSPASSAKMSSNSSSKSGRQSLMAKFNRSKRGDEPSSLSFLRRRTKAEPVVVKVDKPTVEIESGVEVLEDMILPSEQGGELPQPQEVPPSHQVNSPVITNEDTTTNAVPPPKVVPMREEIAPARGELLKTFLAHMYAQRNFTIGCGMLIVCLLAPIPPFMQGVLACLFAMLFLTTLYDIAVELMSKSLAKSGGPERGDFAIPDFETMPICQVPAVEEHKSLKTYTGWMNEINNYDPVNYHISMTRSVYVKLDGSTLRISNVADRVPKRSMWNEVPIDKNSITFTKHRFYNLLGCRIEMCPKGLARKRYYSRKYPIQLTISQSKVEQGPENCPEKETNGVEGLSDRDLNLNHFAACENGEEKVPKQVNDATYNDLGSTIMNFNVDSVTQMNEHGDTGLREDPPCGDDVRLLLFARCDREKEDWFRRFTAASVGLIVDSDCHIPDMVMLSDEEVVSIKLSSYLDLHQPVEGEEKPNGTEIAKTPEKSAKDNEGGGESKRSSMESIFEGLLITTCATRGPVDYLKFMSKYQQACSLSKTPTYRPSLDTSTKKNRRERKEDELWKGIDQSLFLGPSGSVVWANVLVGRILYSCLTDAVLQEKIQDFLQKKLSAIKLPSFMEDVNIAQIYLGDKPPLIHKVSQPLLDERGTWIDADVTYEGLMHMTITTKLNLLRLKRQQQNSGGDIGVIVPDSIGLTNGSCAIYDSDAESTGGSSSESESQAPLKTENIDTQAFYASSSGSSRKFLRIVDRITASNLFQSATEISYIQRAMENMSTKLTLRVELKGLVARVSVNLPPPPSDRIWIGFRGPPRMWITAKPTVGDHTFDWSIVTNIIESKLCEEVYKYLVYPNMVDIIVPFLGQSTYQEM